MAKIEGKCKEVLNKTEWVAIVTCSDNGPHCCSDVGRLCKSYRYQG